jgi:dihydrofolate reductase
MRKIVVCMSISVDGYFEGPGHDLGWHRVDDEVHTYFNDVLRTMSAFLGGRVTHELMADFWPTADADPSNPEVMREFARIWRDMPKIVYSTTLESAGWSTTVVRGVDADEVRALKALPGGDMALGGGILIEAFRRLDLIDEYRLYVHPVLLGRGTPLFRESGTPADLRLVETRTFGNGVVLLRYACVPQVG